MNPFEGKSPAERNKLIAAIVLGLLALFALYMAFGPKFGGSTVTTTKSPTPKPTANNGQTAENSEMPSRSEMEQYYMTTPITYNQYLHSAPDPGRNIFAFYEPPPKTPYVQPTQEFKTPPPPVPTPTPDIFVTFANPQSVYAGSKGFRLELIGERFEPDSRIYFSQSEMPTKFISSERLTADIPASFITGEGPRQIIVQTGDGKKYSNPVMLNVMAPPRPQLQYIGMIARKGANNDTAYFTEQSREAPLAARLNDVLGGRFRLMSISSAEVIFEDTSLGFRHRVALFRPDPGSISSGLPAAGPNTYQPTYPGIPTDQRPMRTVPQNIPGIPQTQNPQPENQRNPTSPPMQPQPAQPQQGIPDKEDRDGN